MNECRKEIKKILCAVDFSEYSKHTVEEAITLAEKLGAELMVMNVVNEQNYDELTRMFGRFPQFGEMADPLAQAIEGVQNERAEKMKALLAETDARRVPHTSKISYGIPYEKILETAEEEYFDLIVLGAYGRGSLIKKLRFGSNAEKIFRRATCRAMFIR